LVPTDPLALLKSSRTVVDGKPGEAWKLGSRPRSETALAPDTGIEAMMMNNAIRNKDKNLFMVAKISGTEKIRGRKITRNQHTNILYYDA